MRDQDKSKEQLIAELERMRLSVAELLEKESRLLETENQLRESEERFRLLYKNTPLGYQSLDEAGRLIEVNQAWLDTSGTHTRRLSAGPSRISWRRATQSISR